MQRQATGMAMQQRGRLMAIALFAVLLLTGSLAHALTIRVTGASGSGGDAFVSALSRELGPAHRVVMTEDGPAPALVVALHEGALQESRRSGVPLLAVLPESGSADLLTAEGALYWAPSWTDQLRLAHRIFPSLRRVGVLLDNERDLPRARALREQARHLNLEVLIREADPERLVRHVAELATVSDVIIAPADSQLFTRNNLKPVLLAAYRQNRVFIGPTPAVVRAGALASLYVTPEILAAEVAGRIRRWQQDGNWGAASRISRFDVITNPQVARSLGLKLPDIEQLTKQLRAEDSISWP